MIYQTLFFKISFYLLPTTVLFGQVGINTTEPKKMLDVAGDVTISSSLDIGTFRTLTDEDESTFLVQNPSGPILSLDVSNPTSTALGYVQEYTITNPDLDWVLDFNTNISSNDFDLIVISSYYNKELILSGANTNGPENTSLPYTATFIKGTKWHIIADYPVAANLDTSEIGTWTITTLIFSKDLSKQFGTLEIPMSNASIGTAETPIID